MAAGTLLACGSVLAVAVHATDSSFAPSKSDPPSGLVTAGPDTGSGGYSATPLAVVRSAAASPVGMSPAPAGNHIRSGPISRNTPLALDSLSVPAFEADVPASEAEQPLPLSLPAAAVDAAPASGPVEHLVAPAAQAPEGAVATMAQVATPAMVPVTPAIVTGQDIFAPVGELIAPVDGEGTQPAMTMLSPLLLGGHA